MTRTREQWRTKISMIVMTCMMYSMGMTKSQICHSHRSGNLEIYVESGNLEIYVDYIRSLLNRKIFYIKKDKILL